eukprot:SAG11_NODE_6899_length_1229_cov_1.665487_2_plen_114_part_00
MLYNPLSFTPVSCHTNCTIAPHHRVSFESLQQSNVGNGGSGVKQSWTTYYDDAVSLKPKYEAAKAAGWRGVGFWQADGMWPYPYENNVTIYCKDEMDAMWQSVRDVWAQMSTM